MRRVTLCAALLIPGLVVSGCQGLQIAGLSAGPVEAQHVQSATRTAKAFAKTFEDITPKQEYYIGRAVSARILQKYPAYEGEQANRYVNRLGQALAAYSDRPETYGGYHFLVLDTDTVNALSAPGGFVFVTRGLIERLESESALAGVLAHEISHIANKHGLKAIEQDRLNSALGVLAQETVRTMTSEQVAELTEAFEGTVGDVANQVINAGYSRSLEEEADRTAVALLQRVGYPLDGYRGTLQALKEESESEGGGVLSTHPYFDKRLAILDEEGGDYQGRSANSIRRQRFSDGLAAVL